MLKFIMSVAIAWFVGVLGWAQVIGSVQNIKERPNLWLTLILWIAILIIVAYIVTTKFAGLVPLGIGYIISLIQVLSSGKIE